MKHPTSLNLRGTRKIVSVLAIVALFLLHLPPARSQTLDAPAETTVAAEAPTEPTSPPQAEAEAEAETSGISVCVGATTDADGDGVCDEAEDAPADSTSSPQADTTPVDTDYDGTPNYLDTDDDGDGVSTEAENSASATSTSDTAPEETLVDSDADSVPDYLESNTADTDHDGATNNIDPDDDGDTIPTIDDGTMPDDPAEPVDTDGDSIPDYLDSNDDGDAIPTLDENSSSTSPIITDTDRDTVPDYLEPNTTDTDGDGMANVNDPDDDGDTLATADEGITDTTDTDVAANDSVDADNDGTPNLLDPDDDGDGVPTTEEDTNHNGTVLDDDADNDSIPDFEEPNIADTDHDGLTNNVDSDDDGDSVPTAEETDNILPKTGTSGSVQTVSVPSGGGGHYLKNRDTDRDGIPDYLDTNDDGDEAPTKDERGDSDSDGLPDYRESNIRDLDKDGTKNNLDREDDGDGILTTIDSNPYSPSCYSPNELGYALFVAGPAGTKRTAADYAKKTILSSSVIRYDFELGSSAGGDNDFNDLAVRVNDEGHRSFVATVMDSNVGAGYAVHLQILGDGNVEKDLTLWTNPGASVNVPQRIAVNQYLAICADAEDFCPAHVTAYMRQGATNDPAEVSKLQSFLVEQEGFANVSVSGVFDSVTDVAVRAFQEKHAGIVLGPWGIQKGTGYVYRTTAKRINDLYCADKKSR